MQLELIGTPEPNLFTVGWTVPAPADADYDGFRLTYEPADGALESPVSIANTRSTQTLTGLEPATLYSVVVVTVSGLGTSTETTSFNSDEFTATTGTD